MNVFYFLCRRVSTYLIVLLIGSSIAISRLASNAQRQAIIGESILNIGGNIWYDYQLDSNGKPIPFHRGKSQSFLAGWLGRDFVHSIYRVDFDTEDYSGKPIDKPLSALHLRNLLELREIRYLAGVHVCNRSIFPFRHLKNLKTLHFDTNPNYNTKPYSNKTNLDWIWNLENLESLSVKVDFDTALKPLQGHPKLRKVSLVTDWSGRPYDLSALGTIPNLEEIKFEGADFPNLEKLVDHPKLRCIHLKTEELSPPGDYVIPNLTSITVECFKILDLSVLRRFPNLQSLEISDQTTTINTQMIENLTQLRSLHLPLNNYSKTISLEKLKNLNSLVLYNVNRFSFSQLPNYDEIQTLIIYSSEKTEFNQGIDEQVSNGIRLKKCRNENEETPHFPKLETLILFHTDVDRFPSAPNLRNVEIVGSSFKNIHEKWSSKRLKNIELENCNFSDLDILKYPEKLKTVRILNTPIKDISALTSARNLKRLSLIKTQITDISPIENLMNLFELDLSEAPFQKYHQLSSLKKLGSLKLLNMQNEIDLEEIAKCSSLKILNLEGSKFRNLKHLLKRRKLNWIMLTLTADNSIDLNWFQNLNSSIAITIHFERYLLYRNKFPLIFGLLDVLADYTNEMYFYKGDVFVLEPFYITKLKKDAEKKFPNLEIRFRPY